jgi:site-specific recombinase XerD
VLRRNSEPRPCRHTQIWNRFLKGHFGSTKLADYKAGDHHRLLLCLRDGKLGRRTIAQVRSVASAIFTHAGNLSLQAANPIRSIKTPKTAEPADTAFYSIGQMGEILHKLQGRTGAQLLVALCCDAALRPSEAVALHWSDIGTAGGMLHVRMSCKFPTAQMPFTCRSLCSSFSAWQRQRVQAALPSILPVCVARGDIDHRLFVWTDLFSALKAKKTNYMVSR